jgi:hypothetical protein
MNNTDFTAAARHIASQFDSEHEMLTWCYRNRRDSIARLILKNNEDATAAARR